jgi:hypothetical protein
MESFLAACYEACVAEYAVNAAHEAVVKAEKSGDKESINSAKEKFQAAYNRSCAANAKHASYSAEVTRNANLLRNKQPPSRAKGKS